MNLCPRWVLAAALAIMALTSAPAARADRGAWHLVQSQHFIVRTDAEPGVYQPLIERLEDVHEALRTTFFQDVPIGPVQVLLFASPAGYRAVAPPGLVGFFAADLPTSIPGFEDGVMVLPATGAPFDVIARTAAHELAHQFLFALGDRVPRWLHEGFAKYVGALAVQGDEIVFDATKASPPELPAVPLPRLLGATGADFRGKGARASYQAAWHLVRALIEALPASAPAALADNFKKLVAEIITAKTPRAQTAVLAHLGSAKVAASPSRAPVTASLARGIRTPLRSRAAGSDEIAALTAALTSAARPVEAVSGSGR